MESYFRFLSKRGDMKMVIMWEASPQCTGQNRLELRHTEDKGTGKSLLH